MGNGRKEGREKNRTRRELNERDTVLEKYIFKTLHVPR